MPQKLRCRVLETVDHGGQVHSLTLASERPAPRFLPGQFLHLALDEYNPGNFWLDHVSSPSPAFPTIGDNCISPTLSKAALPPGWKLSFILAAKCG